jgi:hypothetical protein
MFTENFSNAPDFANGAHMFFGGSRYTGIPSLIRLYFVWRNVVKRMKATPGYRGHFVWYRFPWTIGNVSLWETRDAMMAFARSKEHRDSVTWLVTPGTASAAFIRFMVAEPHGHTIGAWRAEEDGDAWRTPQFPFSTGRAPAATDQ